MQAGVGKRQELSVGAGTRGGSAKNDLTFAKKKADNRHLLRLGNGVMEKGEWGVELRQTLCDANVGCEWRIYARYAKVYVERDRACAAGVSCPSSRCNACELCCTLW